MGFDPVLGDHEFFAAIALSPRVANLATDPAYNTLQLHAIPKFADGSVVPGTVTFTSNDPDITVSPSGLITATDSTATPAVIYTTMRYNGITRTDSVIVSVIHGSPAALVQSISIQPFLGDSAKSAASGAFGDQPGSLHILALDAHGDSVPGLLIDLTSSDSLTANITSPGIIIGRHPGVVTFYATTYAYGVTKTDSLEYTVGQSIGALISTLQRVPTGQHDPIMAFDPGTITIGVGGTVIWFNQTTQNVDITFDAPATIKAATLSDIFAMLDGHPGDGNIPAFHAEYDEFGSPIFTSETAARKFTKGGTYTYHSQLYGTTGTIIVCDEHVALCSN